MGKNKTVTSRHPVHSFSGAPNTGSAIACWSALFAQLLKNYGPHARAVLTSTGPGDISLHVEVDKVIREPYVAPRPRTNKPAGLERYKDAEWKVLPETDRIRLKNPANVVALAAWEAKVTQKYVKLQNPSSASVRPRSTS